MHKLVKGGALVAACFVLAGCPWTLRAVKGDVKYAELPFGNLQDVPTVDTQFVADTTLYLASGASVRISDPSTGAECTFNGPATVRISDCKKDDDEDRNDRKREQDDRQEQTTQDQPQQPEQQQQVPQEPAQQPEGGQASQGGTGQPATGEPSGTATGAGASPGAGGGSGVAAGGGLSTLQTTLLVIGGAVAGKELYDQIRGDDPPVSP